jgi:hypothetical protein
MPLHILLHGLPGSAALGPEERLRQAGGFYGLAELRRRTLGSVVH